MEEVRVELRVVKVMGEGFLGVVLNSVIRVGGDCGEGVR